MEIAAKFKRVKGCLIEPRSAPPKNAVFPISGPEQEWEVFEVYRLLLCPACEDVILEKVSYSELDPERIPNPPYSIRQPKVSR